MGSSGGGDDGCDPLDLTCQVKRAAHTVGQTVSEISNNTNRELGNATSAQNTAGLADVFTQYASGGLLGSKDGQIGKGVITHGVDEAVGEITGRNLQRKAIFDAKDAADVAKSQQNQAVKDKQVSNERADIAASNAAGYSQRASLQRAKSTLGSPEQDFLGL